MLTYFNGMTDLTVKNFVVKMSPSMAINRNCVKVIMFPAPGSSLKLDIHNMIFIIIGPHRFR